MAGQGAQPDPVSVTLERQAQRLLDRLYASERGEWVTTLVYDPPARHVAAWAAWGIDVTARDVMPGSKARTRWMRSYVRALYRLNKAQKRRPLEFQVGRRRPPAGALGWRTPLRVRVLAGGQAAQDAARRKPAADRIYTDDGERGTRWSDPALRDW